MKREPKVDTKSHLRSILDQLQTPNIIDCVGNGGALDDFVPPPNMYVLFRTLETECNARIWYLFHEQVGFPTRLGDNVRELEKAVRGFEELREGLARIRLDLSDSVPWLLQQRFDKDDETVAEERNRMPGEWPG